MPKYTSCILYLVYCLNVGKEVNPLATDLAAELFVPLLLLLHVLGEVEDGVKQEATQTTQQTP